MNEVTWQHVLAWEALHAGECAGPQLLRFTGRPDELRYKSFGESFGCELSKGLSYALLRMRRSLDCDGEWP